MESEQIREYHEMEFAIIPKLRQHAFYSRGLHAFQYLILPSFTPLVAWDVFIQRERTGESYRLVRTCWRKDLDYEKLRTPTERLRHPYPLVPTIELHYVDVDAQELQRLDQELRNIPLTMGAQRTVGGVDGVFYEVALGQPPHSLPFVAATRVSWWHKPPAAWSALGAWAQKIDSLFTSVWSTPGQAHAITADDQLAADPGAAERATALFRTGHYGRAAELLTQIRVHRPLTVSEAKMLELAVQRADTPRPS